jgi:hypothetical protein
MAPADDGMRVGTVDRDTALRALTEHHGDGRLTTDEYHRRCGLAALAATRGELRAIFRDLPAPHPIVGPAAVIEEEPVLVEHAWSEEPTEVVPYQESMSAGRMFGIAALVLAAVAIVVWWDQLVIIAGVLLVLAFVGFVARHS